MTTTLLRAAALLALPALALAAPPRTEVAVDGGTVAGAVADGVVSWKGVPYAAPPVGELRWKPPQPVVPWAGVRGATRYANDCMQEPFPSDAAPLGTPPAEDCLYVNVWAPENPPGPGLPVMFWIHGGGFVNGGSSPAVYDGSAFARRGVVFVSLNYRLGRFGFFAHPALTKEQAAGPLGNYGYLDQIAALRWVERNIAAFGGDPGNVTIFGESAGGGSVHTLMVTPLARGLFHKAIVQSGGGRAGGIMTPRSLKEAESVGVAFATSAGITAQGEEALAALRRLPAEDVVRKLNMMSMGAQRETYAGPMIDGTVVAEEPETAFRAGRQARVPYVIGANDREFGFMPLPPPAVEGMLGRFGAERDAVVAAYDPEKTGNLGEVGVGLMSDGAMVEPARLLARLASGAGQPTWAYRFSYVASALRRDAKGALHATEIPFVFQTVRAKYGDATTAEDEAISAAANAYWAAFARSGDPNGHGRPSWPAYSEQDDVLMDFTSAGPVARPDPWKARLDLVERFAGAPRGGRYTLVVEGYDWGAGVSKVILSMGSAVSSARAADWAVAVKRSTDCVELPPELAAGERLVLHAYVSDAKGEMREGGDHVTLVLGVSPEWPLGSPLHYARNERCRGNVWVDYALTVTEKATGRTWDTEAGRVRPLVDRFDLSGRFVHESGTTLSYASFAPRTRRERSPLIVWLHGGGEGGSDPSIPLLANRATSYASDAVQAIFEGAYVLVPQCPGAWMHNAQGVMTHGKEDDVYHAALMALIRDYVAARPGIDRDRIYVGGCSNGGYMALKLMLLHPDDFAAGFISALAYQSQYLTDEQIRAVARLPIWFAHSADDQTTRPELTVLPVYERLKAAGGRNVHLSYFDHVVDVTGFFGGDGYRYNGHWSWVYLHANQCRLDRDLSPVRVDGRPVSVLEWLAAQKRKVTR